jgi:hypothetical protein
MDRYRFVRFAMFASALLAAVAWWRKDALPPPEELRAELRAEPIQVPVSEPPTDIDVKGVHYRIQRRYSYDLYGLVVSLHHSDTWWDYIHEAASDHINLMDVCVVWGPNAVSGIYREVSFSNSQWECRFSASSMQVWKAFDEDAVSNNHLVTDNAAVARQMRRIHVGDQVRLRGYLINYTTFQGGVPLGTRVSSDTRTDTGNGACEVIYVESAELLGSAGYGWRVVQRFALLALAASVIGWMRLPVRPFDVKG